MEQQQQSNWLAKEPVSLCQELNLAFYYEREIVFFVLIYMLY